MMKGIAVFLAVTTVLAGLFIVSEVSAEQFTITIRTTNKKWAETEARVFIILGSGNEHSDKIYLDEGKFEQGGTDVLDVNVDNIDSPISSIQLGHDNTGERPGWHVRDVKVYSPATGITQIFPIHHWVKGDSAEGMTLEEDVEMRQENKKPEPEPEPEPELCPVDFNELSLSKRCSGGSETESRQIVHDVDDAGEIVCDTQSDGGGWILIQRRIDGVVDFYRGWEEYKNGFGNTTSDFWLGLDKIHKLTWVPRSELRVDITYNGTDYYAQYSNFRLYGEADEYKIEIDGYSGTAGDSLTNVHNGQPFSTKDRDNDSNAEKSCAQDYHGAWWYKSCHESNLNGLWGSTAYADGLSWLSVTGHYESVTFVEMKVRPIQH